MNFKQLGGNICALRINAQMSQEELADKVGLRREMISFIEHGLRKPSIDVAVSLSKIFGVTLDELIKGAE